MPFTISQEGLALIKSFEGCVLKAYQDPVGIWTIGYGHTHDVHSGMTITAKQADAYLRCDVADAEQAVNSSVTVPLTQNMFDALVSFTFNVGIGAFKKSTLLRKLNQNKLCDAVKEFDRWVYAGGKKLPGLARRRASEKKMFTKYL